MSEIQHNPKLTSPEIASLWTQYQGDTMATCVIKHMLKTVEDPKVKEILEFALSLSQKHIARIKEFFTQEKYPIPIGFTDDDVNLEAPRLFSDHLCLQYQYIMAINGMAGYSLATGTAHRQDVRNYFLKCFLEASELFNHSLNLLLSKGLVTRPPYVQPDTHPEYVQSQGFLAGYFGQHRALASVEISHLHFDIKKIDLSKSFTLGFAQVAQSKEVREFLLRGAEIYTKQIEVLSSILRDNDLAVPQSETSEVTNSTVAPFSDKLMMFHKAVFSSTTMGLFGASIGTSLRRDIGAIYARLLTEMMKYCEDNANIMIKNGWLEKAPSAVDREKIVRNQEN